MLPFITGFKLINFLPHLLTVSLVVASLFISVQYGKSMEKTETIKEELETVERVNESYQDSRGITHDDALQWLIDRQKK